MKPILIQILKTIIKKTLRFSGILSAQNYFLRDIYQRFETFFVNRHFIFQGIILPNHKGKIN